MWAKPRAEGYQLDSIPFYAKGVALGDVVEAVKDDDGGLVFKRVLNRGGHSTYRVFLFELGPNEPHRTLAELRSHGFGVEYDIPELLSVDIPPTIPVEKAEELLFAGVDSGRWELQEGYRAGDR